MEWGGCIQLYTGRAVTLTLASEHLQNYGMSRHIKTQMPIIFVEFYQKVW